MQLTEREAALLEFERQPWHRPASKEEAIRTRLGMSPASYYLLLSRLVESEAALSHDPLLVHRLRRRIAARTGEDG